MTHFLLLKFEDGFFSDEIFRLAQAIFSQLSKEVPAVGETAVLRNCIVREENADLLVRMELSRDGMKEYLEHPLHRRFVDTVDSHVVRRMSFDCEN